jgi:hypothetical protein
LDDGSGFAYYRLDPIVPEPEHLTSLVVVGLLLKRRAQ